jgi:hypothetical protein
VCFLSEQDLALINKHRRPANRLGFAILLSYLREPGFTPDKNSLPRAGVMSRVADRLKLQPDLWREYVARKETRWEHLTELYRYLRLSPFSRALQKTCIRHLYPHAMRTDKGLILAEEMLAWLHNNNVIFPSVDVVERTLAEAAMLADRAVLPRNWNSDIKQYWTVCWHQIMSNSPVSHGCYSPRVKLTVKRAATY